MPNHVGMKFQRLFPQQFWKKVLLVLMLAQMSVNHSNAATSAADTEEQDRRIQQEEQHRRTRQEEQERLQRQQQKDIFLQKETKITEDISLPEETPSFTINKFELDGDHVARFPWAKDMLDQYTGRKIGMQGINIIVKGLTNAFIDRGYVTTRVLVPEQDLSGGTLRLTLVPGVIRDIHFQDTHTSGNWRTAFPARPGDILNLRDLEQGLEQMKRVPSQDVDLQIVPGEKPGESDVVIAVKRHKPWRLVTSFDDSGFKATGKLQTSETLFLDNLFGLNDLLNISVNSDADHDGQKLGTRGDSVEYSFPYGRSTFAVNSSHYRYHQTVESSIQPFLSSGEADTLEFRVSHLVHRDQTRKTSLEFGVIKKKSRSYIDDTEIEVQRKDTTAAKIGISHRQYFGQTTFDAHLAFQKGVTWFGAQAGLTDHVPGQPTTRYGMWLLNASLTTPVRIGKLQAYYSANLRAQYTDDLLYGSEFFSIGSRYTVRGFDGEQTLSAERGWFIRSEVSFPLTKAQCEIYVGLDTGQVSGPSTQYLLGRSVTGSVLGLRGAARNVQYDFFVGWPVHKPHGFVTGSPTYGFQLVHQI